jgi:hypothetical protein
MGAAGLAVAELGRAHVDATFRSISHQNVWVIGDAAVLQPSRSPAVQSAIERMLRLAPAEQPANSEAWLTTVATRLAVDQLRSARFIAAVESGAVDEFVSLLAVERCRPVLRSLGLYLASSLFPSCWRRSGGERSFLCTWNRTPSMAAQVSSSWPICPWVVV